MDPKSINSLAFTFSKCLFKSKNKNGEKSAGKSKCHRPGPLMRNPYLNFLREFRKHNCGLTAVDIIKRGAQAWKAMPKEKRLRYIEEAFYAPKRRACAAQQSWSLSSCAPKKQHRRSVSSCSSRSRVSKKKSITSSKRIKTGKGCTRKVKSRKRSKKAKKLRCGQRKRFRRNKLKFSKSKCKRAKISKRKKKPNKCI
uniref:Protamine n=1 Tax=Zeugodacus cucurbitae TaxID=28588 RepID=A0A0A1X3A0_ZEUCU